MKQRKVPLRTCVVSNEKCEKKDLLRVVRNNEGIVFVDDTHKANGRGAYIKKDVEFWQKRQIYEGIKRCSCSSSSFIWIIS